MVQTVDVVIVGGGISGLATARGLVGAGFSVRLFEGRERSGGRLESVAVPGGVADLGASWFWPGESRVRALVDELGLAVHSQWTEGDALFATTDGVQRLQGNPIDVPAFRFSDGAGLLASRLADRLPKGLVELGRVVRSATQTGGRVDVRVDDETVHCEALVLALPPSLALSSGLINGNDLSELLCRVATETPVWMGSTVKAVAVYGEAFWRGMGLSGSAISHVGPLQEIHDMSGPDGAPAMLFGFGRLALGQSEISTGAVIAHMARLFGPLAETPVSVVVRSWGAEALTAPSPAQRSDAYEHYGSPAFREPQWSNRLFWTSTETATVSPGHIEGALQAAERTVNAIRNSTKVK